METVCNGLRLLVCRGYLAPEYSLLGQLTKKADVYSFGVLLLEIISGKSSSKAAFGEELLVLVEWVCLLCPCLHSLHTMSISFIVRS